MINAALKILGIERYRVSHTERLVSALGAFAGILAVLLISTYFIRGNSAHLLVASMGASAVLLFAVPHGTLSQPWPLLGGHFLSALIGVSCAQLIPELYLAAPLAVGIAVGAMHYARCIHPPGGATALAAVAGGADVHALGYGFATTPVLLNAISILLIAILFNYLFPWRRYPSYLSTRRAVKTTIDDEYNRTPIAHADFVYALSQVDSFIDVSEHDLLRIYELVAQSQRRQHYDPTQLELGHYYSNGKYGDQWSVRQIVDWADQRPLHERELIYKVVAGKGRRSSGTTTLAELSQWARHEVFRDEENWRRVPHEREEQK